MKKYIFKYVCISLAFILLGIAYLIGGTFLNFNYDLGNKNHKILKAPDFCLQDLDGKEYSLSALEGKPVVLVFCMVLSCRPCVEEVLFLAKLHEKYKDKLEILAISGDLVESGPRPDNCPVKIFQKKNKIHFPILVDEGGSVAKLYRDYAKLEPIIPFSFFIDKNGNVAYKAIGFAESEKNKYEELIKGLI